MQFQRLKRSFLLFSALFTLTLNADDIMVKESCQSVDATANSIKDIVRDRGLAVFAIINHGANAQMVDMELGESKMIVFGNAKVGTVLMQQDMRVGLDLPLRILVYKDHDSRVKMAYRDGSWLTTKHILNAAEKIRTIDTVMENITTRAGRCLKD
ncbi:MAG: DUF302 domain-containing protein [Campylobacterales bacterium]|nr:DUF302 domain-containing protein [Campylobacterales bacterium]